MRFLTEFGIDLFALCSTRRHFCRLCLDWTERRPHLAGALGAALTQRCFDLGWTERMKHSRAVVVTAAGNRGFLETFGITVSQESQNRMEPDDKNLHPASRLSTAAIARSSFPDCPTCHIGREQEESDHGRANPDPAT